MTRRNMPVLLVEDNDSLSFSFNCLRRSQMLHRVRHPHLG